MQPISSGRHLKVVSGEYQGKLYKIANKDQLPKQHFGDVDPPSLGDSNGKVSAHTASHTDAVMTLPLNVHLFLALVTLVLPRYTPTSRPSCANNAF